MGSFNSSCWQENQTKPIKKGLTCVSSTVSPHSAAISMSVDPSGCLPRFLKLFSSTESWSSDRFRGCIVVDVIAPAPGAKPSAVSRLKQRAWIVKREFKVQDPSCGSPDAGRRAAERLPAAAGCAEEGKPGWRSDERRRFAEQPAKECVWTSLGAGRVCVRARVYGCVLQLSTDIYVTGLPGPSPWTNAPTPPSPNGSEFKGIFWEYYRTITTINSIRSFTLLIRRTITRKWQRS